jgi:hypothetical protein
MQTAALLLAASLASAPAGVPTPRYLQWIELPEVIAAGTPAWPADEISGMAFSPLTRELLIVPDDRSQEGPARVGRLSIQRIEPDGFVHLGPIRWSPLLDRTGSPFEKNTVDPEAVCITGYTTGVGQAIIIAWASEGYAKGGVDQGLYTQSLPGDRAAATTLPEAFRHDRPLDPTRGVRHNRGFESVAFSTHPETQGLYAAVERPLIQDEGSGVCRVLVHHRGRAHTIGYPLGPAPEGTDAESAALADLIALPSGGFFALENADRSDGTVVSTLWWTTPLGATHLDGIASLADPGAREPRFMEKRLVLDLSTLSEGEGLGDLEAMAIVNDTDRDLLLIAEDNDGKGPTRMLVFELAR